MLQLFNHNCGATLLKYCSWRETGSLLCVCRTSNACKTNDNVWLDPRYEQLLHAQSLLQSAMRYTHFQNINVMAGTIHCVTKHESVARVTSDDDWIYCISTSLAVWRSRTGWEWQSIRPRTRYLATSCSVRLLGGDRPRLLAATYAGLLLFPLHTPTWTAPQVIVPFEMDCIDVVTTGTCHHIFGVSCTNGQFLYSTMQRSANEGRVYAHVRTVYYPTSCMTANANMQCFIGSRCGAILLFEPGSDLGMRKIAHLENGEVQALACNNDMVVALTRDGTIQCMDKAGELLCRCFTHSVNQPDPVAYMTLGPCIAFLPYWHQCTMNGRHMHHSTHQRTAAYAGLTTSCCVTGSQQHVVVGDSAGCVAIVPI